MQTIEVPRKDWPRTLDSFSQMHDGWLISLQLLGPELGAQPQIEDLPLRGVTAETYRDDTTITISAARGDGELFTHAIASPSHVRIERTNQGADVALEIESVDGTTALMRFKNVVPSEAVDGVPRRNT